MDKLIFLDIDGVLNTIYSKEIIEDSAVNALAKIVSETSAEIILISSWDMFWLDEKFKDNENIIKLKSLFLKKMTYNFKLNGIKWSEKDLKFVRTKDDFKNSITNEKVIDLSDLYILNYENSRRYLVDRYILNKYDNLEDVNYLVIDDFIDLYKKENHIRTSYYDSLGLLKETDVDLAVSILNNNRVKKI